MGWFLIPKPGEKLSWAMYDIPTRKCAEYTDMQVIGKAMVHGIEGVEIVAVEHYPIEYHAKKTERTFVAQLTESHCRLLSESHLENDVRHYNTFLDPDDFIPNWGFGEDNCGNETQLAPKHTITRNGSDIYCDIIPEALDVVGRYTVELDDKTYDTICVMDIQLYNNAIATEQFIDTAGKTILWRRYNRDDWAFSRYKQKWSEKLPDNEKMFINGEIYVHWYDCITDYIL
jgi:hypothetical protein